MIRPLRIQHRRMLTALAVVLPVTFALGIIVRKSIPPVRGLSTEIRSTIEGRAVQLWERDGLFTNAPVRVRLLAVANHLSVACSAPPDFLKPDLLVYWAVTPSQVQGALPTDAVLLGTFDSPALPLPLGATKQVGTLILFSLADQEVIAISQPIQPTASTR